MRYSTVICAILCSLIGSCHKEEAKQPVNIDLKHAPLTVIKESIAGNWELRLDKGGFTGAIYKLFNPGENRWSFSIDAGRFNHSYQNSVVADTVLVWSRVKTSFGDSAYNFSYIDKQGFPNNYIPDRIRNDTLILLDDAIDGITHYLIRN